MATAAVGLSGLSLAAAGCGGSVPPRDRNEVASGVIAEHWSRRRLVPRGVGFSNLLRAARSFFSFLSKRENMGYGKNLWAWRVGLGIEDVFKALRDGDTERAGEALNDVRMDYIKVLGITGVVTPHEAELMREVLPSEWISGDIPAFADLGRESA
jgi:hypothetical protein